MGVIHEYRKSIKTEETINIAVYKIYRGNDLGTVSVDNIDSFIKSHGISSGKFTDLYVGDYFTATYNSTIITFRVMDINPYYGISESGISSRHHVLIVPDQIFKLNKMTKSNSNTSGYKGSYMYSTVIPTIDSNLYAIFGDHLLSYNEIVSTDNSTSTTTVSVRSILMNEMEVFGKKTYSKNISGLLNYQLPGFKQNSDLKIGYYNGNAKQYWERDCCGTTNFCCVYTNGSASDNNGYNNSYGVRPRFLLG